MKTKTRISKTLATFNYRTVIQIASFNFQSSRIFILKEKNHFHLYANYNDSIVNNTTSTNAIMGNLFSQMKLQIIIAVTRFSIIIIIFKMTENVFLNQNCDIKEKIDIESIRSDKTLSTFGFASSSDPVQYKCKSILCSLINRKSWMIR